MVPLRVGQRFRLGKLQSGIVYYRENHGLGPYAIPARFYLEFFNIKVGLAHRGFSGFEVFQVIEARQTVNGWHVIALSTDEGHQDDICRISFFQQVEQFGPRYIRVELV